MPREAFYEEVLCLEPEDILDVRAGFRRLPPLVRRWLLFECAAQRMRQRYGQLPEGSWCPHCGRGSKKGPATVAYVKPPEPDTLYRMRKSED